MSSSFRAALLSALILLLAVPAFASGAPSLSYDEALAAAKEQGKVVVIDFFADWCGPCKAFDADLAAEGSVIAEALGAVVFTSIDAEKGEGIELAKKYGVAGYPTYTMMNAEGELIESWVGYGGPQWYVEALETALADPTTFVEKQERYTATPTADQAMNLGRIASSSGQTAAAMEYLLAAEELDPEVDATSDLLDASFTRARKDDSYSVADHAALARERIIENDADLPTTLMTTYYLSRLTANEPGHETIKPFLVKSREMMAASPGAVPKQLGDIIALQAIIVVDGDMAAAVEKKRSMMPEGWMEDANQLNDFAWWCFENEVNLEEAQQLALKGVELAEPGSERAQILDTAAEICNLLGSCDQAIALIKRAIEDAPASEYYPGQLARFEQAAAAE